MNAKHTPGPWRVNWEYHPIEIESVADPKPKNCIVAEIPAEENDTLACADARLIAAAPELLEALQELVKRCPFVATATGVQAEISFAQIKQAQSALAKAV
jgi:hypothetical protein